MKTFSITMISLVAGASIAFAQGAPKQPDPKAGATAGAGVGVKAGAGSASTGVGVGAKAGAGTGTGTAAAKTTTGTGTGATAQTGAKMEMPKPPAEIATYVKSLGATLRCTGVGMGGDDMKTELKFTATLKSKTDLDGWWIRQVMDGKMGTGKTAMKFKMESFTTFDANSKKWRTLSVMNDGGAMMGTSDGPKEGKMTLVADSYGPWGQGQMRDNQDTTDPKNIKMWGEMSMDKGKTWMKVYDMTCKK